MALQGPQQGVVALRHAKAPHQALCRPSTRRMGKQKGQLNHPTCPPGEGRRDLRQVVDEGLPLTVSIAASPSRQLEPELDGRPLVGQVLQPANIPTEAGFGFQIAHGTSPGAKQNGGNDPTGVLPFCRQNPNPGPRCPFCSCCHTASTHRPSARTSPSNCRPVGSHSNTDGSSSICVDGRANATTWPGSPPHRGPPRPPGWALAGGLSLRVGSAGKDQGSWLHRKPLVSGASADQVPSRWRRRDGPRGPEHFFHGAGNRADRRGRALHKASMASDGASDEPPGVELIGAHMLPLYPSELHADWKRSTQIEEDPHCDRRKPRVFRP